MSTTIINGMIVRLTKKEEEKHTKLRLAFLNAKGDEKDKEALRDFLEGIMINRIERSHKASKAGKRFNGRTFVDRDYEITTRKTVMPERMKL